MRGAPAALPAAALLSIVLGARGLDWCAKLTNCDDCYHEVGTLEEPCAWCSATGRCLNPAALEVSGCRNSTEAGCVSKSVYFPKCGHACPAPQYACVQSAGTAVCTAVPFGTPGAVAKDACAAACGAAPAPPAPSPPAPAPPAPAPPAPAPAPPAPGLGCSMDTAKLRSPRVLSGFEPSVLDGTWYEVAYTDIGQVGAKCARSTNTYDAATGAISQKFEVNYGPVPFPMTFAYQPDGPPGLYHQMGNNTFKVAVVDVDPADGTETYIEYKCAVGLATELRFSARSPNVTADTVERMKGVCRDVGVPDATLKKVKVPDNSKCKY